jgi:hypothetical protein
MSNNFQRTHDSSESGAEVIQDNYDDVPATLAEFVSRVKSSLHFYRTSSKSNRRERSSKTKIFQQTSSKMLSHLSMQPARGSATAYSQRCGSLRRQRGGRGVWSTALPNRRKSLKVLRRDCTCGLKLQTNRLQRNRLPGQTPSRRRR